MLKLVNQLIVAVINAWIWSGPIAENTLWLIPAIAMGLVIVSFMDYQDYEDDVFTFAMFVSVPLIFGVTFSDSVQAFIAQWGFLGALLVVFYDFLLFGIITVLLYIALDYDDFIPFQD